MENLIKIETTNKNSQDDKENQPKQKRNKDYFKFRNFIICHKLAAMKVGTDGVLLGGVAAITKPHTEMKSNNETFPRRILDIGCGSGLITMFLADKFALAKIDCIDIDKDAVIQTSSNLKQRQDIESRVTVHHISIQDYKIESKYQYDLITCAPPYFIKAIETSKWEKVLTTKRKVARHLVDDSMDFNDMLDCAGKLLDPIHGVFCFVFPTNLIDVTKLLNEHKFEILEIWNIKDSPENKIIRQIFKCRHRKEESSNTHPKEVDFSIYTKPQPKTLQQEKRIYTAEYRELLEPYMLTWSK